MRTDIMATAGPTMQEMDDFREAMKNGVRSFRLAIGQRKRDTLKYFSNIRKAAQLEQRTVDVLIDLPSSKLRLGEMEPVDLVIGQTYTFFR